MFHLHFTDLNRVIIRRVSLTVDQSYNSSNKLTLGRAYLFPQSCLNIKRRVHTFPQCLKSYRSIWMWVGQAGLDDSDWLFDTSRCPPRGLSRRQCVAVPLKAPRTIPSVITHTPHAHYTQHKQVQELTALLYCT